MACSSSTRHPSQLGPSSSTVSSSSSSRASALPSPSAALSRCCTLHRPRLRLPLRRRRKQPFASSLSPLRARAGQGDDNFNSLFPDIDSDFKDVDRRFEDLFQQSERLQRAAEEQLLRQQGEGKGRTYKRENSSEEKLQGGGFRRSYFSESVTIYGDQLNNSNLSAHSASAMSNPLVVLLPVIFWLSSVLYVAGLAAFYATFDKTSFGSGSRIAFALLWPFLFAFSSKFRTEFKQAIQNERRKKQTYSNNSWENENENENKTQDGMDE